MNTLQIAASVAPSDGGPSTAILALHEALREAGIRVQLVVTDADGLGSLSPVDRKRIEDVPGLSLFQCHRPRRLKTSLPLALALRRAIINADIVHIHGLYLFHTAAGYAWARLYRKPYLLQPHGVLESYQRSQGRRHKLLYDRLVGRRIMRNAAGLVFTDASESLGARAVTGTTRHFLVPLGASLPPIPNDFEPPARWEFLKTSAPIVIFLGRIAAKKRVDVLLEAWPAVKSAFPQAALVLAGPVAEPGQGTALMAWLAKNPFSDVHYLGSVAGAEKTFLLSSSSAFVLPSENENFAISVVEAMCAGVPVVTTQQVAAHRHVEECNAGIVIPLPDPQLLARALIQILSPGSLPAYQERARAVGFTLTWSNSAKTLIDVYESILKDG